MAISDLKSGIPIERSNEFLTVQPDLKQVLPIEVTNIPASELIPFGIDPEMAMEVLQNRMYTNKDIPFQELPSNGRDAIRRRIMWGDTKFKPEISIIVNADEGTITVKDNGCGISKANILNVYRFYGVSDKRNIAGETGMFGYGAKTPFIFADQFDVETDSMEDMTHRTYMVNKRGLMPLSEEPSVGNFGTSIIFANPSRRTAESILHIVRKTTGKWKCPVLVYAVTGGVKNLYGIASYEKEGGFPIEEVGEGVYPEKYCFKIEAEDYVAFIGHDDQSIYDEILVDFIPYKASYEDIEISSNRKNALFSDRWSRYHCAIYIKNPNIVTISATREGIEKDNKMRTLLQNISDSMETPMFERLESFLVPMNEFDPRTFKATNELKDIRDLVCFYFDEAFIHRKYQLLNVLFKESYSFQDDYYAKMQNNSFFSILTRIEERDLTVTWSSNKIAHRAESIPEKTGIIHLNAESGKICRKEEPCFSCEEWNRYEHVGCYDELEKKEHWLEAFYPRFTPAKIPKAARRPPESFRSRLYNKRFNKYELYTMRQILEECNNGMKIAFEDYKYLCRNVRIVTEKKWEEILLVYPQLLSSFTTNAEYEANLVASFKIKNALTQAELNFADIVRDYTTIVESRQSEMPKINTFLKLFSEEKTLFVFESISEEIRNFLTASGVVIKGFSNLIQEKKVTIEMNCQVGFTLANTITDYIDKSEYEIILKDGKITIGEKHEESILPDQSTT